METNNNFGLSPVKYINEIFPLSIKPDNMPISYHIEDLKDVIVGLSELMLTMDKKDRENISTLMVKVSGTCKMLSEMKAAVLRYSIKVEN